jgi:hypothetical protein
LLFCISVNSLITAWRLSLKRFVIWKWLHIHYTLLKIKVVWLLKNPKRFFIGHKYATPKVLYENAKPLKNVQRLKNLFREAPLGVSYLCPMKNPLKQKQLYF